jgi:hypothetical protein
MPRIERISEGFPLPEGSLCLGANGWTPHTEQLSIHLGNGLTLEQAMDLVWREQQGLLGDGELVFYQLQDETPHPQGYIVFHPADDDGE